MDKSALGGSTTIENLNIPLIIRGEKVGLLEMFVVDDEQEFPKILIGGTLIKKLQHPDALAKLLQLEGIHLGKP